MQLISPQDAYDRAVELQLQGHHPETSDEWLQVATCIAYNLHPDSAVEATVLCMMCVQCPLHAEVVRFIAQTVVDRRAEERE